jgi:hypothetical protein
MKPFLAVATGMVLTAGSLLASATPASATPLACAAFEPHCNVGPINAISSRLIPLATSPGLAQGLYVQVIDGTISLSNSRGSTSFTAGQFGFTPSAAGQPPAIVPAKPSIQFTPPSTKPGTKGALPPVSNTSSATGADVAQGGSVQFQASGLIPGAPVNLYLTSEATSDNSTAVGTLNADSTGAISGWARVPANTPTGTNYLHVSSMITGSEGSPVSAEVTTAFNVHTPTTATVKSSIALDSSWKSLPASTKKTLQGVLAKVPGTVPNACTVLVSRSVSAQARLATKFLADRGIDCATKNVSAGTSARYSVSFKE